MAFTAAAVLLGVGIVLLVALQPRSPTSACYADANEISDAICTPDFADYHLVDALYGRLSRTAAENYLTRWPTSLATRYMSDVAMYRWQLNASATEQAHSRVSSSVLSRLVAAEVRVGGVAPSSCVVHVPSGAPLEGIGTESFARHNLTLARCGSSVEILASAAVPHCTAAALTQSKARLRLVRYQVCAAGFATTTRLGLTPDEAVATLGRAPASISLDAALDEVVTGVRAHLLAWARS